MKYQEKNSKGEEKKILVQGKPLVPCRILLAGPALTPPRPGARGGTGAIAVRSCIADVQSWRVLLIVACFNGVRLCVLPYSGVFKPFPLFPRVQSFVTQTH